MDKGAQWYRVQFHPWSFNGPYVAPKRHLISFLPFARCVYIFFRASKKKVTFCISLTFHEPRNNFQNCLFLPKTDIHMYTEPSLGNIRELSYLQNLVLYEVGYPP